MPTVGNLAMGGARHQGLQAEVEKDSPTSGASAHGSFSTVSASASGAALGCMCTAESARLHRRVCVLKFTVAD